MSDESEQKLIHLDASQVRTIKRILANKSRILDSLKQF